MTEHNGWFIVLNECLNLEDTYNSFEIYIEDHQKIKVNKFSLDFGRI